MRNAWLRLKIWPLSWAYRLSCWLTGPYNRLCEELAQREALQPGTRIRIVCEKGCGSRKGSTIAWTIERFNADANDYYVTTTEAPDDGFKRDGYHFAYVRLECFEVIDA